jgi:hypothetical protein
MSYTKKILDRNNTNFPLKLTQVLKELVSSKGTDKEDMSFLKYHQNLVRYFSSKVGLTTTMPGSKEVTTPRGLLIYHQMGTGKTLQAIAIAMEFIEMNMESAGGKHIRPPRDIIVILAKSLRENFLLSIKKYINLRAKLNPSYFLANLSEEDRAAWIERNFHFVTLLASNMIKQIGDIAQKKADIDIELEEKIQKIVDSGSLDGKVLIIDEVQNLFRAITNGSKGATALYNLIMAAADLRLFLLSGTPISNNPFETVACFNMLAGSMIFPENYGDFKKYFIDSKKNIINHKNVFQNRITGLVSYVGSKSIKNQDESLEFPEEKETKVLYIPMTRRQYSYYIFARDKEKAEGTFQFKKEAAAAMTKPKSLKSSTYRQRSRQVGNYCPPDKYALMKYSEINIDNISAEETSSPKFEKVYSLITTTHKNQLCICYSQFAGIGGLATLMKFLVSKGCIIHHLLKNISNLNSLLRKDDNIIDEQNNPDRMGEETILKSGENTSGGSSTPKKISLYFDREVDTAAENEAIKEIELEMSKIIDSSTLDEKKENKAAKILKEISTSMINNGKISIKARLILELKNEPIEVKKVGSAADKNMVLPSKILSGQSLIIAIISGEVPVEIRSKIIEEFNSPENIDGSKISLLLITRTGAEGLDLKRVRGIFILEPPWTYSLISQIKARGVRFGSHIDLPPEDRNVQTYIFVSTKPDTDPAEEILKKAIIGDRILHPDELDASLFSAESDIQAKVSNKMISAAASSAAGTEELLTTDMHLYYEALRDRAMIDSFLDAIKESSIECEILGHVKELGLSCRQCSPTNMPLFTNNIERDCVSPDPCSLLQETSVKARQIEYNGRKIYYVPDLKSLYGYSFFEHSATIGKFIPANVAGIIDELLDIIEGKK